MKQTKEVITITAVNGNNVSYSGGSWDGCRIENFPDVPKVGDKYTITQEFNVVIFIEKL
jgi:hypothetical protein